MHETKLLMVRHPETEANVTGRFVGRGDSPYTDTGRIQARRLAEKVARFAPEAIYASPLRRALTVGRRAALKAGVALHVDPRLAELDFGEAEGLTWEEIADIGIEFNYRSAATPVAPGGESRDELLARVGSLMDELDARGGRFAIVAHAGVIRAILAHVLGLSTEQMWLFHMVNAQLVTVRIVDGHGMLEDYRQG
jgi:glucosyl-3-phosphoglycerate phosphatase